MSKITGKVAQLLDSRELVINKGSEAGVSDGMRFAVLSSETHSITDPDNPDQIIGSLPITKTIVKVTETQPKMAIAKTFRTIPGSPGLFNYAMGVTKDRVEEYMVASGQQTFRETLSEDDLAVGVGDIVEEYKDS
ncbi:hypothetical protein GCM10027562_26900 [Arthrobacter pigmenti]